MNISYNWLKKYVALPSSVTASEVAEKLKMSTVEVEGIMETGQALENVVVGQVVSAEKHPNADKLKVCSVNLGNENVQIVCGGTNVSAGMLVAVAKVGAKVKWHGEGELVELAPAKIRGVESFGMICGADEIGLTERFPKRSDKEIIDLKMDSRFRGNDTVGQPLAQVLGLNDAIFEIDNKSLSNRPDLWGHYGLAREVAVLTNHAIEPYKTKKIPQGSGVDLSVTVKNKIACPKYMAVAMTGVAVGPSPAWLKEKLAAVAVRAINNIVDATNFVMLDLGQPLHAFDRKIIGDTIIVRKATAGERMTTLDEKERKLSEDMLVIAAAPPAGGKAVAIAGVMGGLNSGISDTTTDIIIEAANFEAASIRQTSTRLGLRSDSSVRFEKSLDHNLCSLALERIVMLVQELCPTAKVASKVVEVGRPTLFTGPLTIPISFFEQKIGVAIPVKTISNILSRLGFGVKEKKEKILVTIPTWRATKDISRAEDVVEEVVRIYGYEKITATLPTFPIDPPLKNGLLTLIRKVQDISAKQLAYTEVYNYSFVSVAQIIKLGDDIHKYLELDNPISKEKPYIRRNLLPNLLENAVAAIANREELKIFEIGSVFAADKSGPRVEHNSDELLPRQDTWFTALYVNKKDASPFREARRAVEMIFNSLNLTWEIAPVDKVQPWEHPTRLALVLCGGKVAGVVFELHPRVATAFGLSERMGACSINLSLLTEMMAGLPSRTSHQNRPLYPEVIRDVAFLVKKEVTHGEIIALLQKSDPLLKEVELFDVFEGKGVGEDKKSLAYHLTYGSSDRTLTSSEVDTAENHIIKLLQEKCGAEMRK
ncbi:MAG: phenylalanine--tRNA ligase subunit beta [Candidatus Magasanikbacteria bacterium]|nr:phenylalanine--tRNA ligase subunit beta [Candidatus Magasanikbacteria bacterium]